MAAKHDDDRVADFRSDTFTAPTPEMRRAMAEAEVGDDVWGEDPTVQRLERAVAELLGQPAGLLVPSGTMGNQIAVHVHCRPGDELICHELSHTYWFEGGSIARLSGTQARVLPADDGFPTPVQVEAAVRPDDPHFPRSRLLVVENSHNMAGGRVLRPDGVAALVDVARRHDMAVHVDGARICNAAVAAGCEPAALTRDVDSVSMCLSKGLGAPVGSVLVGSAEFVDAARRVRKAFGGGMRQAGVLAAAGLVALDGWAARLAADHERARRLADGLESAGLAVARPVETNIVMVGLDPTAAAGLVAALGAERMRAAAAGPGRIRFVTHRDVDDDDLERCLEVVRRAHDGRGGHASPPRQTTTTDEP